MISLLHITFLQHKQCILVWLFDFFYCHSDHNHLDAMSTHQVPEDFFFIILPSCKCKHYVAIIIINSEFYNQEFHHTILQILAIT